MEDKVRDCPLCGNRPTIVEHYKAVDGILVSGVACHRCNMTALHLTTQEGIDLWNEMVDEWHEDRKE